MTLRDEVLRVVKESGKDFILTETVVKRVTKGCLVAPSRAEIVGTLDELWRDDLIRHPVGGQMAELDWWREVKRGYTRGEKKRMFLGVLGFYPVHLGRSNNSVY